MITHITLRGFKSFDGLDLPLRPFQVLVGVNAAGKSNLFDALQLLSRVTNMDLLMAFGSGRGDVLEYFTRSAGYYQEIMKVGVEMLLPLQVTDEWGQEVRLKFNRLRYNVTIVRRGETGDRVRLEVREERLEPIKRSDDRWLRKHGIGRNDRWVPHLSGGRSKPFISTTDAGDILLHQDGHGGLQQRPPGVTRTVLSGVSNAEFPHALAVRQELGGIKLLQFDPSVMRRPAAFEAPEELLPSGDNLAAMLARLEREDRNILKMISAEVASFVPSFSDLRVERDPERRLYKLWARQGKEDFSAQVLSDGTLRLIALTALQQDPAHSETILFEEPENGVHPTRLVDMRDVLKGLATDFSDENEDEHLRQILVNTHSPRFMAEVDDEDLLLVHTVGVTTPGGPSEYRSRVCPVRTSEMELDDAEQFFSRHTVEQMLDEAPLAAAKQRFRLGVG